MKMKKILVFLCLISTFAYADIVTFDPPIEREDGSPLPPSEIAGYNVYDLGSVSTPFLILPGTATSFDLAPSSVDQSFVITTKDTDGRESVYSSIIDIPKLVTRPKAPGNIRITPSGR